jgi:hypothetical protein
MSAARKTKSAKSAKPRRTAAKPTSFKTGTFDARPDRLDFRDLPYRPPLKSLPPQFPDADFIRDKLPAYIKADLVRDQGEEGACTGFGLACVVNYLFWVRHIRAGTKGRFARVSPRMLYELARRYDEWPGEGYDGSSCRGALKGWQKHGVCAEDLWRYRDDSGAVALLAPEKGWDADAVTRPLGVYYRIDKGSVVELQAALQEIGAVYVSAQVHDGWDRVGQTGLPRSHDDLPVIDKPKDPKKLGGHAFALVGYNAQGFIVQNSWGPDWGASGFAVLPYADWVAHGSDAWAVALGVPQRFSAARIEAVRWPAQSGRALGFFSLDVRNPDNPPDDPWPIDRDFAYKPYQPWSTAEAYAHTLVTGNDGTIEVTDLTSCVDGSIDAFMHSLVVERPMRWLAAQAKPKLMIYAHGGLNSEQDSIDRIRVLAPYFEANGIYPLFITWRTGPFETIGAMVADAFGAFFGTEDAAQRRAAGFWDALADARDRRVEELARGVAKGIWSEMRENAERGANSGRGLGRLAQQLAALRGMLKNQYNTALEVHLVGHSAGSILHGHLLKCLAASAAPVQVASCALYAAACSVEFALEHYLEAAAPVLPIQKLHLDYLSDRNEKDDYLAGVEALHLYGKSLLYLVSRALEDARKMPLLGFERALDPNYNTTDYWAQAQLTPLRAWQAAFKGSRNCVAAPSVPVNKQGKTQQAQHGSFDNNVEVIGATIARISGKKPVQPIEWLDY